MSAPVSCREKAVELLARRAHFRLELQRKLEQRRFESEEIHDTLERLGADGYLDDPVTADLYVSGRLRRGGIGPRKLIAELRQRGVDEDVASSVVSAQITDENELANVAAEKWLRSRSSRQASPAGLARHLERAGFHSHVVASTLRQHRD